MTEARDPIEAAEDAYSDHRFDDRARRYFRPKMRAAIAAYLRTRADVYTQDLAKFESLHGTDERESKSFGLKAEHCLGLAAEVEREGTGR